MAKPTDPKPLPLSQQYLELPAYANSDRQFLERLERRIGELIQTAQRQEVMENYGLRAAQGKARHSCPGSVHHRNIADLRQTVERLLADLRIVNEHRVQRGFLYSL